MILANNTFTYDICETKTVDVPWTFEGTGQYDGYVPYSGTASYSGSVDYSGTVPFSGSASYSGTVPFPLTIPDRLTTAAIAYANIRNMLPPT